MIRGQLPILHLALVFSCLASSSKRDLLSELPLLIRTRMWINLFMFQNIRYPLYEYLYSKPWPNFKNMFGFDIQGSSNCFIFGILLFKLFILMFTILTKIEDKFASHNISESRSI